MLRRLRVGGENEEVAKVVASSWRGRFERFFLKQWSKPAAAAESSRWNDDWSAAAGEVSASSAMFYLLSILETDGLNLRGGF